MGTRKGQKNECVENITEERWRGESCPLAGKLADGEGRGPRLARSGALWWSGGGRHGKEVTEIKDRVSLACGKVEKQNTKSNHWSLFR